MGLHKSGFLIAYDYQMYNNINMMSYLGKRSRHYPRRYLRNLKEFIIGWLIVIFLYIQYV